MGVTGTKAPDGEGEWYCWSMGLKGFWKPQPEDNAQYWPGHTIRCGRYVDPPSPLEFDPKAEEADDSTPPPDVPITMLMQTDDFNKAELAFTEANTRMDTTDCQADPCTCAPEYCEVCEAYFVGGDHTRIITVDGTTDLAENPPEVPKP